MLNKKNIVLVVFVIIAILEFMLIQGIVGKHPELREIIWQEVKNLGFAITFTALGIIIMIALPIFIVVYLSCRIQTWICHRKYQKAQKQILDDPVLWPGHAQTDPKRTGKNGHKNNKHA
jgi:hypothetical protein